MIVERYRREQTTSVATAAKPRGMNVPRSAHPPFFVARTARLGAQMRFINRAGAKASEALHDTGAGEDRLAQS